MVDSPRLLDKLHILREEAAYLRSFKDQLAASNLSLQSENDRLLDYKSKSEIQQGLYLYNIQKLQVHAARLEAERLAVSMIEDIAVFDTEIITANEASLLKAYQVQEHERMECIRIARRVLPVFQELVSTCRQLESETTEVRNQCQVKDIQFRKQMEKLSSENFKLKKLLQSAQDQVQAQDIQYREKSTVLEVETQMLQQQNKKLDHEVRLLKRQLEKSNREKVELQNQLERFRAVEVENANLKEKLSTTNNARSRSLNESIGRVQSAISTCDQALVSRAPKIPKVINCNEAVFLDEDERVEDMLDEMSDDLENRPISGKRGKLVDPNWSDMEENIGCKKVTKKHKSQSALALRDDRLPRQPRKLFAERTKSKMFTTSPGLSSVDHPFTDMLQLSGSVASVKDKGKKSRTRSVQKLELSQES